ncbi:hypothetical protein LL06_26235 [Hoeflea sp. BAL378]|uniref:LysR family transcriptional regulator n=1 Tax=Hoeflea sp. BAL378 TaxID=1547437 RepID=UPI000512B723|nr:LysR family transcriptional regulator [Hoeflea sp. BAL378]KGF66784.1 hypothetical protein LL06_26235 [Hoeflea sp. BAL378]
MIDWNDLRYFLAVARQGSTLAASRGLAKSQSTVHRRLGELEAALGRPLVKRHPTGYRLTPFGLAMLPYAEEVERAVGRFDEHQAAIERAETGILRLTCPEPIMARLSKSGFVDRFHLRHPELRIEFVMSDSYVDLAGGEADVAFRSGDTDDGVLVGRKLADSLWAVYATRSFVDQYGRPASESALDAFPIAALDQSIAGQAGQPGHRLSQWLAESLPGAAIVSHSSSILGLVAAVRSDLGVGALPTALGDAEPDLVRLTGPVEALTRAWRILAHPDVRSSPRVSAFFDFVAEESAALKTILTG